MNKLSESHILAVSIGLLVLVNNFVWTLKEKGHINMIDYESEKIQIEKTMN